MAEREVRVPDLGDFESVDVIEVHVAAGDVLAVDDPLITVETDKAAMDVPAPFAGTVVAVRVATGAKISAGDLIAIVEAEAEAEADGMLESAEYRESSSAAVRAASDDAAEIVQKAESQETRVSAADPPGRRLVVLGAGPGGYTAAFRAADLGLEVTLVERQPTLGGVCLNVGCIPSKALLHAGRVIEEAREIGAHGVVFGKPDIDAGKLVAWKDSVIGQLAQGLTGLAAKRAVTVVHGTALFESSHRLTVQTADGVETLDFDQCIIAAGSEPTRLPGVPDDPRIVDSTGALEIDPLPDSLLVIGGGIIGLEMATVYDALGVRVSVVELTETLIPGCDRDLVRPLQKRIAGRYESIMLGTAVTAIVADGSGLEVHFEGKNAPPRPQHYDRVLVAVGRRPSGDLLAAERAGVEVDRRGFIPVDKQMRTNVPHIFAIGDIVGQPMLAHKATHEGRVAAEVAAGKKSFFDAKVIPSVAYTDPEIAWVGLSEETARAEHVEFDKGVFPWAASGRSLSIGRTEGLTKLIVDRRSRRLLGVGVVGTNAGELIAEAAHAIEMGSDAEDLGLTIHPHPTLSETLGFAAEVAEGTITDLYIPKR